MTHKTPFRIFNSRKSKFLSIQNLYLAGEAINAGTCAIAAYDQEAMDRLLKVDGTDEFTIYLAPVGKVKEQ